MNKYNLIILFFYLVFTSCNENINSKPSKEIESEEEKRIANFIKPKHINHKKGKISFSKEI